jgi:hypothetical protein
MPLRRDRGQLQEPQRLRASALRALSPRPVEVYCRLPVEQAAERHARRGTRSDPHPVHVTRSLPVSAFHEFQEPMGLGPVLEVDTSTPVDVPALAKQVIATLQRLYA